MKNDAQNDEYSKDGDERTNDIKSVVGDNNA